MINGLRKSVVCCVFLTLALTPFQLGAQEGSIEEEEGVAEESTEAVIEEIIVTAQKREQNLQDVSISITALDSEGLDNAGITDISRMYLVTPGMNFGFYGVDAKIAIRGAHSNNTYGDNQSIAGFYIDGIYRPRPSQQSQGYFDVERVEVLKGPQGTLYGRNTFSGAVNLYTKKPTTAGSSYGIELGVGNFGTFTTEGFGNFPVGDDFALRFAFSTKDSDGYIKNSGSGQDIGSDEARNFRLSGLWTPSDNVEILLRFTSIDLGGNLPGIFAAEGICRPVNSSGATDAFGTSLDCSNASGFDNPGVFSTPHTVSYDVTPRRDYTEDNATLDISWYLSDSWSAHVIGSYTDFVSELSSDGDFSNRPGYRYYFDEVVESNTAEVSLTYAGDRVIATMGAYWSDDQFGFGYSEDPFGAASYCGGMACIYADFQDIGITTTAAFLQLEASVTDRLRLIGGIRYNDEEKDTRSFWTFTQFDASGNPLPGVNTSFPFNVLTRPRDALIYDIRPDATKIQNFDITTWKAGLEWDVNDGAMVYANAATGYLSGGVNGDGTDFGQQENLAYELGVKSRLSNGTVQLNAAVYMNEGTNLTTQRGETINGVFITTTVNGGTVDTTGAEVELLWLPNSKWRVNTNFSWMDAEHTDFGINNGWQQAHGEDVAFLDLAGTTPPWAPDFTLSVGVSYFIDLGDRGLLTPFIQFYYSDEYNTDDLVTYFTQVQDSYTKTDFRLMWTSANGRYSVEGFIENIEDEAVLARTNIGSGVNQSSYLYPQTYGARLFLRF